MLLVAQMLMIPSVPQRPRPLVQVAKGGVHSNARKSLYLCGLGTLPLCVVGGPASLWAQELAGQSPSQERRDPLCHWGRD